MRRQTWRMTKMAKMDYGKYSPYKLSKESRSYAKKGIGESVQYSKSSDIKSAGESVSGEYGDKIKMKSMPKTKLY